MNPVQEVRELISYGLNRIEISMAKMPKTWVPVVDLELIASGYMLADHDESKRIYTKLIKKENRK